MDVIKVIKQHRKKGYTIKVIVESTRKGYDVQMSTQSEVKRIGVSGDVSATELLNAVRGI